MKSIILASLLLGGSLFFSGCDAEDAVKNIAGIETSMVYFVNANSVAVVAKVEDNSRNLTAGGLSAFNYTGRDGDVSVSYTISGQTTGSAKLNNGDTHIYVSTDCNAAGYLTHKSNSAKRIQIVNASGVTVENGDYSVTVDGVEVFNQLDNAPSCAITPVTISTTKGHIVLTRHSDGKTLEEDFNKNYSFDIVVLPNNSITLVPLIGFDDIK